MNEEKRKDRRFPVVAEIEFVGEGIRQKGRISDLSRGGVFVDTLNPVDISKQVGFSFLLPGDPSGKPITGEGVVAWNQPMVGMGLHFTRLADGDLQRIVNFLSLL